MRKASVFVIITALAVLLIACSQENEKSGMDEPTASQSSFSAGETEETTPPSEESASTAESATETPAVSEQSATTTALDSAKQPSGGQSTAPPKTESQPPAATTSSKPTEQPKPTDPPKQTDPPATSTPTPVFDPQPYVDYAISYGTSIGLQYEAAIGTGNWNSPLNLYASLTDESMKKGIRSSCNILITEGFEYFYPYAEKQSDGSYRLYIYFG
jgi:hypothetical protein